MIILSVILYLTLVLATVIIAFYFERKIPAFIQDRMGPMEAGKFGILQGIADLLKLIQKEDIRPRAIDPILFLVDLGSLLLIELVTQYSIALKFIGIIGNSD